MTDGKNKKGGKCERKGRTRNGKWNVIDSPTERRKTESRKTERRTTERQKT
jgi:hypothetical protein